MFIIELQETTVIRKEKSHEKNKKSEEEKSEL